MKNNWLQRSIRTFLIGVASLGVVHAAPPAPVITQVEVGRAFVWVLIHSDVPFLVPSSTPSAVGTAYVSWAPVAGATFYQYRVQINGQWSTWTSTGSNTFANLSSLSAGSSVAIFEVLACDASGCSTSASSTAISPAWVNVGQCDPGTGKQMQLCVLGLYCSLNSTRLIDGGCQQASDCP